jgi:hypothetical protein
MIDIGTKVSKFKSDDISCARASAASKSMAAARAILRATFSVLPAPP